MASLKCNNCQRDFSPDFACCPNCGKKRGMSFAKKAAIGVAVVTAMLAVVSSRGTPQRQRPWVEAAATTEATPDPSQPTVWISATDLYRQYDENEVAADEQFKGRTLSVTGSVESIGKDFTDSIVIELVGGRFRTVRASMNASEKNAAAHLVKGQKLSVLCKGRGKLVGSPVLKNCTIDG